MEGFSVTNFYELKPPRGMRATGTPVTGVVVPTSTETVGCQPNVSTGVTNGTHPPWGLFRLCETQMTLVVVPWELSEVSFWICSRLSNMQRNSSLSRYFFCIFKII